MSCGKHWKRHFRDPKSKNFLGEYAMPPSPPKAGPPQALKLLFPQA